MVKKTGGIASCEREIVDAAPVSFCSSQETESAGQGREKAKVSSWTSNFARSEDSSAGGGACLAKAARLLGVDVDTLTRKVERRFDG